MQSRPLVALLIASFLLLTTHQPQTSGVEPSKLTTSHGKITPECRKSIDRGMRWLISAIRADGMVGVDVGQPADLGCTSIVGLALLAQGNTRMAGPHAPELRRVLDGVLNLLERRPEYGDRTTRTTTLVQRKIGYNADLFLAALFLSQSLGESGDAEEDVRVALEKVVAQICRAQGKDGTWGDESWAPVLGTVLGWESLRASSSSGLAIDASAQLAGDALLKKLKTGSRDEQHWMHEFYKNASSIRVLYSLNYRHEPAFKNCVDRILRIARDDDRPFYQAGGEEYLAFFLVTECLLQDEQNETWRSWYPTVRDKIIRVQNSDGSWSGHHCITARTFCTAAALLTLQSQNLYLPASNL